jgi:hypothetical protein
MFYPSAAVSSGSARKNTNRFLKKYFSQAVQKHPDARHVKS